MTRRRQRYQWPSKLALAGNKPVIKIEGHAEFPAEAADTHVNATDKVSER